MYNVMIALHVYVVFVCSRCGGQLPLDLPAHPHTNHPPHHHPHSHLLLLHLHEGNRLPG